MLGPRLGRAGTRVGRKGGESSVEAVSGRGREKDGTGGESNQRVVAAL